MTGRAIGAERAAGAVRIGFTGTGGAAGGGPC